MPKIEQQNHRRTFGVLLAGSVLGLIASFVLSIDALMLAKQPDVALSCNISLVLNCATVALHPSSHLFGFPNSFVGMMSMPVLVTIAVAGLAGVRFPRWFMRAAQIAAFAGLVFAGWMFYESYAVIQVLCPWCLATDLGMLAVAFAVVRYNALEGNLCVRGRVAERMREYVLKNYDVVTFIATIVVLAALIVAKYGSELFG